MPDKNKKVHDFLGCPEYVAWLKKTKKKCPECRAVLEKTESKCPKCGAALAELTRMQKFKLQIIGNIIGTALVILISIVILHLILFMKCSLIIASSDIHVEAKYYFVTANFISKADIILLENIFGFDNLLVIPLKDLRDSLYQKGVKNLPKGDGEKYLWWAAIYFSEYEQVVVNEVDRFGDNVYKYDPIKREKLFKLTDELYQILEPIAKSKIRDKSMTCERLNYFNRMAFNYFVNKDSLMADNFKRIRGKYGPYFTDEEINKQKHIYYLYKDLTDYTYKNEKENYNYYFDETEEHLYHYLVPFSISKEVLLDMERKGQTIDCNNEFLTSYGKNYGILRDKYQTVPTSTDARYLLFSLMTDLNTVERWSKICSQNPEKKYFNDYFKNSITVINHYD